jgi:PPOX class probable F420-dependent enzyme
MPSISAKLKNARIAHLATVDPAGRPHIVPVCFVYRGKVFYTAIDRKPKRVPAQKLGRLRNIKHSPHVALLIDSYDEDWSKLWYMLVRGEARLLLEPGGKEHRLAIRALKHKYPQYRAGMLTGDAPIIRITVERISSWRT